MVRALYSTPTKALPGMQEEAMTDIETALRAVPCGHCHEERGRHGAFWTKKECHFVTDYPALAAVVQGMVEAETSAWKADAEALKDGCDYARRLETTYRDIERILTSTGGYVIRHAEALTTLRQALAYDARPGKFRQMDATLAEQAREIKRMQKGIDAIDDLISNSHGVIGLHLNG